MVTVRLLGAEIITQERTKVAADVARSTREKRVAYPRAALLCWQSANVCPYQGFETGYVDSKIITTLN